jgi:hypothetical protein
VHQKKRNRERHELIRATATSGDNGSWMSLASSLAMKTWDLNESVIIHFLNLAPEGAKYVFWSKAVSRAIAIVKNRGHDRRKNAMLFILAKSPDIDQSIIHFLSRYKRRVPRNLRQIIREKVNGCCYPNNEYDNDNEWRTDRPGRQLAPVNPDNRR